MTTVSRGQDFFVDFDHNNDGCITKHEFLRNIYRIAPKLSDAQAELLVKIYGDRKLPSFCSTSFSASNCRARLEVVPVLHLTKGSYHWQHVVLVPSMTFSGASGRSDSSRKHDLG